MSTIKESQEQEINDVAATEKKIKPAEVCCHEFTMRLTLN